MAADFETRVIQGREVCTVKEAARALGVSSVTVSKYMDNEILGYITLPSGIRQPLADDVREQLALNQ